MPKRTQQQEELRLWKSGQAIIEERKRIIDENKGLQSELENLRKQYKIALKNNSELVHWFESQPVETLANFSADVNAIKEKYSINERMSNAFWGAVWNIPVSDTYKSFPEWRGMPQIQFTKDLNQELVITTETDITNEIIIEFIKAWQKTVINTNDRPPQPKKKKDSTRLDWRPVWEWRKRHPQISINEIAKMLGKNRITVDRALVNLDNENPLQM